jgi:hypothetical protein
VQTLMLGVHNVSFRRHSGLKCLSAWNILDRLRIRTTNSIEYIQDYYKRNRHFQHFIKPELFKISTLTMHGFVEKLRKFATATCICSMYVPLITRHISTRWTNSCQTHVNISTSTPAVAVVIRCFRSSKAELHKPCTSHSVRRCVQLSLHACI